LAAHAWATRQLTDLAAAIDGYTGELLRAGGMQDHNTVADHQYILVARIDQLAARDV
jgi:hypothetical protein